MSTTVGILGGGQLARMMALAGAPLGLRFLVMDTAADACAGQFAPLLVGDYRDDMLCGKRAGNLTCLLLNERNRPFAELADFTVESLEQLASCFVE